MLLADPFVKRECNNGDGRVTRGCITGPPGRGAAATLSRQEMAETAASVAALPGDGLVQQQGRVWRRCQGVREPGLAKRFPSSRTTPRDKPGQVVRRADNLVICTVECLASGCPLPVSTRRSPALGE